MLPHDQIFSLPHAITVLNWIYLYWDAATAICIKFGKDFKELFELSFLFHAQHITNHGLFFIFLHWVIKYIRSLMAKQDPNNNL